MVKDENTSLKSAFAESRKALLTLALFGFFINLLVLVAPLYMLQMFDRVLSSGRVETLVFLTLIAGVALLVMGALEAVRGRMLGRIGAWLDRTLAPPLIAASVRHTLKGAALGAQALHDLATIRGFVGGPGVNAILDSPWVPVFLIVVWLLHPLLGIVATGAAVALFLVALANEYASRKPLTEAGKISARGLVQAGAAIRNADVIHAMGMLPGFLARWTTQNEATLGHQRIANEWSAGLAGLSKFLRMFAQIAMLGTGAFLVINGELTAGGMIAASILLGRALAPVEQSIGAWRGFVAARTAYQQLNLLLAGGATVAEPMPLPAPTGRLSCAKVTYVPPGRDQPILKGVSFAIEPGEALGIIGPSAAGKSTLCKILVGSWRPTRGQVRLDGADLTYWSSERLGSHVGYLPQDVELFSGSVMDNIARLDPDPDPEAVVKAARIAGVHEMILRLPRGYDTEIGERGSVLSGGERQRVGLARALYGQPCLIVLDEPNASLDSQGDVALVAAIEAAKGWGGTVIMVAHQPRILKPVDKVMILRDGAVDTFGPRDEVLRSMRPVRLAAEAGRAVPESDDSAQRSDQLQTRTGS